MPGRWAILFLVLAIGLPWPVLGKPVIEVIIDGVDDDFEDNIRLFLTLEQQKEHPLMSEGRLQRLYQKAPDEIAAALQPFGYYQPDISSELLQREDEVWEARFQVDPGPAILIASVNLDITGPMREDPALEQLIETRAPEVGQPLLHSAYESFKSRLSGLAADHGYLEARFTETRLEIDLETYEARISLGLESGPRYRFGEINVEQEVITDELLQRYIPFSRGDPYRLDQVIALQQALNDTNYFQVTQVGPGKHQPESLEIPINIRLEPRKSHRWDFGVGYGTDTGARAKVGWRMPRVNERGHRLATYAEISEIGYDVGANYRVPVLNPRTDQLTYSISQEKEETDTNESILTDFGVSLAHNRGRWRETLSLNYQLEDFSVADDSGDSVLLIPSVVWSRVWGNDFVNALDGVRLDFGVRGGTEKVVSDTDFLQMRTGLKFIYSFTERDRVLLRGTLGTTETDDFDQLPSSIRFFAGGSQSVRGYAYESLGPTNENGDVVGGRHLVIGSIEFERYFDNNWGLAVFFDMGNAIDDFNDDLEEGAGFGVRWKSPVGPVRIDVANAISTEDQDWRVHVSIGPDL